MIKSRGLLLGILCTVIGLWAFQPATRAQGGTPSSVDVLDAFAYESITVAAIAIGPTTATISPSGVVAASRALCTTETNSVRYRTDGTSPTSSEGHLVAAPGTILIDGVNNVRRLKMIQASAGAVAKCTYSH